MKSFAFTPDQLKSTDTAHIVDALLSAGFTRPNVGIDTEPDGVTPEMVYVNIEDDVATSLQVLSVLNVAPERDVTLTASQTEVVVPSDGATRITITLTDARGPDAAGSVVKVRGPSSLVFPIDKLEIVMGPDGTGELTFGPLPSGFTAMPFSLMLAGPPGLNQGVLLNISTTATG